MPASRGAPARRRMAPADGQHVDSSARLQWNAGEHHRSRPTMVQPKTPAQEAKLELANRVFFRLYQCANMLHKTGSRAVEAEGLTTQQWAVLGALSHGKAQAGMSIGDLAKYLLVSRQNLSGLIGRMERDGHVAIAPDAQDRRSRVVTMTDSGHHVWQDLALPKIHAYYDDILQDFSVNDVSHLLHYLLKMLQNMERVDQAWVGAPDGAEEAP